MQIGFTQKELFERLGLKDLYPHNVIAGLEVVGDGNVAIKIKPVSVGSFFPPKWWGEELAREQGTKQTFPPRVYAKGVGEPSGRWITPEMLGIPAEDKPIIVALEVAQKIFKLPVKPGDLQMHKGRQIVVGDPDKYSAISIPGYDPSTDSLDVAKVAQARYGLPANVQGIKDTLERVDEKECLTVVDHSGQRKLMLVKELLKMAEETSPVKFLTSDVMNGARIAVNMVTLPDFIREALIEAIGIDPASLGLPAKSPGPKSTLKEWYEHQRAKQDLWMEEMARVQGIKEMLETEYPTMANCDAAAEETEEQAAKRRLAMPVNDPNDPSKPKPWDKRRR